MTTRGERARRRAHCPGRRFTVRLRRFAGRPVLREQFAVQRREVAAHGLHLPVETLIGAALVERTRSGTTSSSGQPSPRPQRPCPRAPRDPPGAIRRPTRPPPDSWLGQDTSLITTIKPASVTSLYCPRPYRRFLTEIQTPVSRKITSLGDHFQNVTVNYCIEHCSSGVCQLLPELPARQW